MQEKLKELIADLKEEEALELVKEMLSNGTDPMDVLETCRTAVEVVGKRFEEGKYFIPDLLMSGEIMENISNIVKPHISADTEEKKRGKVLIGTVEGDIHDIGKNIVTFMLEVNGFDVLDIGVDVPPEVFVEKIKEFQPQVVGLSGLLTLAFDSMKNTIEALENSGLRDKVKIMIGGSPTDEQVAKYVGADAHGKDANAAVELSRQWTEGN
ncbi:MAG: corrinoid protein [Thermacetogeniaceae bacterium]|jgi:5-methyltetrahydrofolate--homocysteine methyltransferase|nr:methionine synthase [Syntrophomonadaceae bacterium]